MNMISKKGFTLIELLVAMAIASIIMAAIVTTYQIQVRAANTQAALTDMTQIARVAVEIMSHEIRMAGINPTGNANARIITAEAGNLIFSLDVDDAAGTGQPNGDCCDANEIIRYYLSNDADGDGINDNIASNVECHLLRETGAGNDPASPCGGAGVNTQPLAFNVDGLNFVYLDADNNVLPSPVTGNDLNDIRSIELTMVTRAGLSSGGLLYSYTNAETYSNQQLTGTSDHWEFDPPDDSFRRLLLTTTINGRNLGR